MNRNVASLLFLAAAIFFAGCSSHPDSMAEAGSSGSPGSSGSTGSTMPVPDTDLAAFARAGLADPEYAEAREVNDIHFVSDENPDAFNDLF